METWAWLIAYVLGFALLQLYLYRYFIGEQSRAESSAESTPQGNASQPVEHGRQADPPADTDLVACTHCGGRNENHAMFTFCRHCGKRLE
ncbi:MAG: hypothetical protein PPP58_01940 [Natronomonas sp.]